MVLVYQIFEPLPVGIPSRSSPALILSSLSGFKAIPVLSRPLQASKVLAEVVSFWDTFARKLKSPAYR